METEQWGGDTTGCGPIIPSPLPPPKAFQGTHQEWMPQPCGPIQSHSYHQKL